MREAPNGHCDRDRTDECPAGSRLMHGMPQSPEPSFYDRPSTPRPPGGVIEAAIRLYRQSFRRCAPLAALGALIAVTFELIILLYASRTGLPLNGFDALMQAYQQPPIMALSLLQSVLLLAVFGALLITQHAIVTGRPVPRGLQALKIGFARLGRCVMAAVIATSLVALGCVLIIPGIYLATALALWPVALYIDDAGGLQSLDESRQLIHHHWWHASIVLSVALLLVLAFSMAAGFIAGAVDLTVGASALGESLVQIVSVLADTFMLPMLPAALLALYEDLNLRHQSAR